MVEAGLTLIVIGWVYQLISKTNKLHPYFVVAYIAGVALIVINEYQKELLLDAALNVLTLILAVCVLIKHRK